MSKFSSWHCITHCIFCVSLMSSLCPFPRLKIHPLHHSENGASSSQWSTIPRTDPSRGYYIYYYMDDRRIEGCNLVGTHLSVDFWPLGDDNHSHRRKWDLEEEWRKRDRERHAESERGKSKFVSVPRASRASLLFGQSTFSSGGILAETCRNDDIVADPVIGIGRPITRAGSTLARSLARAKSGLSLRLFSRYAFRHDRWDFSAFHRRRVGSRGTCQRFPTRRRRETANNLGFRARARFLSHARAGPPRTRRRITRRGARRESFF